MKRVTGIAESSSSQTILKGCPMFRVLCETGEATDSHTSLCHSEERRDEESAVQEKIFKFRPFWNQNPTYNPNSLDPKKSCQ